jgi:hypothetical protein
MSIPIERLTPAFVQAVRISGQYLTGNRRWGWGTAAARYLFREELRLRREPRRAPRREETEALATLAALQRRLSRLSTGTLWRYDAAFMYYLGVADKYLARSLGEQIDFRSCTRSVRPTQLHQVIERIAENTEQADGEPRTERKRSPRYWDRGGPLIRPRDPTGLEPEYFEPPATDEALIEAASGRAPATDHRVPGASTGRFDWKSRKRRVRRGAVQVEIR